MGILGYRIMVSTRSFDLLYARSNRAAPTNLFVREGTLDKITNTYFIREKTLHALDGWSNELVRLPFGLYPKILAFSYEKEATLEGMTETEVRDLINQECNGNYNYLHMFRYTWRNGKLDKPEILTEQQIAEFMSAIG